MRHKKYLYYWRKLTMLKKISKKSIIALFVTMVMIVSMSLSALTVSAAEVSVDARIVGCSHGVQGVLAYQLSSDCAIGYATIQNHAGCKNPGAMVTYSIILDKAPAGSSRIITGIIHGTLVNGVWEAILDYTPPAGCEIVASGVGAYACSTSLGGSF
jgi:hypothetical protein